MSERFVNIDRETPMLFPVDMRDWLPEDHLVYYVIEAIEQIGVTGFKVLNDRPDSNDPYSRFVKSSNFYYTMDRGLTEMGMIQTEITLRNVVDEGEAKKGLIEEKDIRSVIVTATVDTGAASLVISEELREKLGLRIVEERGVKLADGSRTACKLTEAVKVHWKDRHWPCAAVVIQNAETVLLGAIPLEGMDLMINPNTQELVGVHGDTVEYMVF